MNSKKVAMYLMAGALLLVPSAAILSAGTDSIVAEAAEGGYYGYVSSDGSNGNVGNGIASHSEGWVRSGNLWWYQNADGSYPANAWKQIDGKWYYFDESGWMAEGWLRLGDTWYYLNPGSGAMAEGWLLLSDTWYYLNPGSGAMAEGWLLLGDTWYYLNPGSGAMAADTYVGANGEYYVDASGAWVQDASQGQSGGSSVSGDWVQVDNLWWYRHTDGGYTTNGWELINGNWYYFDEAGWMVTGWRLVDGNWYYMDGSGAMATGWLQLGDTWYFLNDNGSMAASQWVGDYYVGDDGKWIPGASENEVSGNENESQSAYPELAVKSDYYYNQLNDEEKKVYDKLLAGIQNFETEIDSGAADGITFLKVYWALQLDHRYYYWVDWRQQSVTYLMTRAERDAIQAQIDNKVDSLLSGVSEDASDYDKVRTVYDAIVNNVEYDDETYAQGIEEGDSYSIKGAIIDGLAVCDGYAQATQYMLQKLGIPCIYIYGYVNDNSGNGYEPHAWNIACIDGKYYHIDTTWGSDGYTYFCVPDEEIFQTHAYNSPYNHGLHIWTIEMPSCTSTDLDPYRRDGGYFNTFDPDEVGNYIKSKYEKGEVGAGVKFANRELYEQAYDYFLHTFNEESGNERIFDYVPELSQQGERAYGIPNVIYFRFK